VIVGGGFGGLRAARALRRAPADVTLVDRRNFHLFQPLLYQVATGGLSPANIASPLRAILKRQPNVRVLLAEATGVDVAGRRLLLGEADPTGDGGPLGDAAPAGGGALPYDTLLVATGSRHSYFGHDAWEPLAPGLKTVEDATEMRRRILVAFESAERETDPARVPAWLTIVIVGAGPTGVELAGAVAELARHTFKSNFRSIDPATASILLVEGTDRVLPAYPHDLSRRAADDLARIGVTVKTGAIVTDVRPDAVLIRGGGGDSPGGERTERIATHTVLWAAGNLASPLGRMLAAATGAEIDRAGRVRVGPDLTLPGHPEILVLGDLALCGGPDGQPLPGVAQVALQQGRYAASLIEARLRGAPPPPPPPGRSSPGCRSRGSGTATIGRAAAVADFGRVRLAGYPAWLVWLLVHLRSLVQFDSRILVFVQWAWSYLTRNRSARLITGRPPSGSPRDG